MSACLVVKQVKRNITQIRLLSGGCPCSLSQVSSYDDVGGEVADFARDAALSAMASAHVIVLVLDVAVALQSQKVRMLVCS